MSTTTQTQPTLSLRNNPLDTEKTPLIESLGHALESHAGTFEDWRDDLLRDGYVVIKDAFPKDNALKYRQSMLQWLKQVAPEIDVGDARTWHNDKMPDHTGHNVIPRYSVSHEKWFWQLRQEPGILGAFAKLWGTDELLASFDAINISLPGVQVAQRPLERSGWQHVDQSPWRNGLVCVQGIAQLSSSGPKDGSLVVFKNSHKLTRRFFQEVHTKDQWDTKDKVVLTKEELQWFVEHGAQYHKVQAEPGDLILWDSRTIHWGEAPEDDAPEIRTVCYVCYTPASWASEGQLKKKQEVFKTWGGTTHWPHDNIREKDGSAMLANGVDPDPMDTGRPREMPELNDRVLKLAGMKPY